jgi:hypothetical protein
MPLEITAALITGVATILAALIGVAAFRLRAGPSAPSRSDDVTIGLADQIVMDARAGRIAVPITTDALIRAYPNRSPKYLATILANYCEPNGDYVMQGQRPRFSRIARGQYRPI